MQNDDLKQSTIEALKQERAPPPIKNWYISFTSWNRICLRDLVKYITIFKYSIIM